MLRLYSVWHLNLAYSSIEGEQRAAVIEKCYWPLLKLARDRRIPLGVEAPAWTLARIAELDADWISELKQLIGEGLVEFVGSGWSQLIGPLVPGRVVAENLRLGRDAYAQSLGVKPRLWLVNEQAWSASLLPTYRSIGCDAVMMEWENPSTIHPEWPRNWRYYPQLAISHDTALPLIWNHSIAFQKMQRLAHGEIHLEEWADWMLRHDVPNEARALCVYGNDAETFNFRPGRYGTETRIDADEWELVGNALEHIARLGASHVLPSSLLADPPAALSLNAIRLDSPNYPIPTKKQPKYNVIRWACGGRDAPGANTICERIYHGMSQPDAHPNDHDWRSLSELWASDFRTHITERRWQEWQNRAADVAKRWVQTEQTHHGMAVDPKTSPFKIERQGRFLEIESPYIKLRLNLRRGLTIDRLTFPQLAEEWLLGTLHHGHLDDISWSADFYTWETVLELPGKPKVTDLAPCEPEIIEKNEQVCISATIPTPMGTIRKSVTVSNRDCPSVQMELTLLWPSIPPGSLRLGDLIVNPDVFDRERLFVMTHLGGWDPETFHFAEQTVDHGKAWSALISAQQCLGATEGWLEFGDNRHRIKVEIDRCASAVPAMVTCVDAGEAYIFRIQFSAREIDDTSGAHAIPLNEDGRTYRFKIFPVPPN